MTPAGWLRCEFGGVCTYELVDPRRLTVEFWGAHMKERHTPSYGPIPEVDIFFSFMGRDSD